MDEDLAAISGEDNNIPMATEHERAPGADALANVGGLVDDMVLPGSFRRAPSDPHIEAHRAPDDAQVEARIMEQMEEITRKVEERLIRDISAATEVKNDICGLKRRTICFMLLFLVLTIGGIVGGALYSIYGDDENNALPIPSPSSLLVEELKEWFIPTEQDLLLFSDPTSAQSQALEWLQSDPIAMATNRTSETVLQRYVLAVLYFALPAPEDWRYLSAEDVCTWIRIDGFSSNGVSCTGKTVDGIVLNNLGLRGTLPWELVLLTNLEFLSFANNRISGSIPSRINELTRLKEFDASSNYLTGTLPPSFGSSVVRLGLRQNDLTGTIPGSWGTEMPNLQNLDIADNALTGTIPSELGLLPLRFFDLHMNALTGSTELSFCGGSVQPTMVADCDELECPCCSSCWTNNGQSAYTISYP
jgi:hypothetical protein